MVTKRDFPKLSTAHIYLLLHPCRDVFLNSKKQKKEKSLSKKAKAFTKTMKYISTFHSINGIAFFSMTWFIRRKRNRIVFFVCVRYAVCDLLFNGEHCLYIFLWFFFLSFALLPTTGANRVNANCDKSTASFLLGNH